MNFNTIAFGFVALLSLAPMAFPSQANAKVEFVSTLVTCQQKDGDTWIEVGIVESGADLKAMIVRNNIDTRKAELLDTRIVHEVLGQRGLAYLGNDSGFGLIIRNGKTSVGALMVTKGVKEPISERDLECKQDSDLRFETN